MQLYGGLMAAKYLGTFMTGWPSGLRRWIKAPVSSGAWVRIPLQSNFFLSPSMKLTERSEDCEKNKISKRRKYSKIFKKIFS